MDPRGMGLKRHATRMLQFRPGTDVALLNAIMNVIVGEGLYDRQYIEGFTEGFDGFAEHLEGLRAGEDGAALRHRAGGAPRGGARLRPGAGGR